VVPGTPRSPITNPSIDLMRARGDSHGLRHRRRETGRSRAESPLERASAGALPAQLTRICGGRRGRRPSRKNLRSDRRTAGAKAGRDPLVPGRAITHLKSPCLRGSGNLGAAGGSGPFTSRRLRAG
jgi:hypothetical protein